MTTKPKPKKLTLATLGELYPEAVKAFDDALEMIGADLADRLHVTGKRSATLTVVVQPDAKNPIKTLAYVETSAKVPRITSCMEQLRLNQSAQLMFGFEDDGEDAAAA